jgi:hypothetical protein
VKDTLFTVKGKAKVKVPMDTRYALTVSRPGYHSKRICISTFDAPYEGREKNYKTLELTLELLKKADYVHSARPCCDLAIFNGPFIKVVYDPKTDEFVFDQAYTNLITQKIQPILEEIRKIEKYNAEVLAGDSYLAKGSSRKAMKAYTRALSIKPGMEYPAAQIKKCRL